MIIDDALRLDPMDEATLLLAAEVRRLRERERVLVEENVRYNDRKILFQIRVKELEEENTGLKGLNDKLYAQQEALMEALKSIDMHGKTPDGGMSFLTYYTDVLNIARAALEAVKE